MFIHDRLGRRKDATGAIVDLIRVASSSGMGSTHLIGHELGHNLMSIARDAGVINEAQQKEIDALFTDKNGKFDEEAFAEAFARELKRAFFETVQKRMEDVPTTKAGRALRRVADFIATLARSFAFWRQERGLDPVTGQPLQAGQVLDAFLKRERTAVDEATQVANAARAAEAWATQEAMANAPTQTVVDEDGTEVAYHEAERGDRDVTAEDFARTFGIRLVMDGDARSQDTANVCYDTLLKLAKLMGVPQETLGIGGLLTLDVSVVEEVLNPMFNPANNTINLPIPHNVNIPEISNATSIVHEWTHALDRIVGLVRDVDPNSEITEEMLGALSLGEGAQVREELLQAGNRMTEALRNTRFYERISNDEKIKALDREYPEAQLFDPQEVSDVREKMQEQVDLLRLREAKKRALERERGVTFTALKATFGVDIPARLRALAGTQEDPFEAAAKLIAEIDDGFDKWVKRDRRDLLDGTEPYTYLNEQGERAYAETMGNVLKAVARDLSYGKLREALLNAADKIARAKPETVHVIAEGKLGRVARVLRLAQNADIVTLARRRIKSALAEANKRLSSANSGMRTRYMTAMRKQAKELIKTMQLAVSAQDNTKASEKKRYAMLAERARLAEELKVIESGKTPDDLAKDETLTDRQHQDAVKLMFLEKFGDLSYTIDPAEVWAKAAEAEAFVVS